MYIRCSKCGVSLTNVVNEDFGKRVVMSLMVLSMVFRISFGFGVVPAVWHIVVCIWKISHTKLMSSLPPTLLKFLHLKEALVSRMSEMLKLLTLVLLGKILVVMFLIGIRLKAAYFIMRICSDDLISLERESDGKGVRD